MDYVAPEEEVDGRTDVYSLGCVLYECLNGEPPYPRDTESMSEITQSVGIRACLHVETKLGDRFAFAHRLGAPWPQSQGQAG